MKFDVDRLKRISRPMSDAERAEIEFRDENRDWLSMSEKIALRIRYILRTEKISKSEFAERMNVTPAQVTKILSGKENLGLKTVAKIERALGYPILNIMSEGGYEPGITHQEYVCSVCADAPCVYELKTTE